MVKRCTANTYTMSAPDKPYEKPASNIPGEVVPNTIEDPSSGEIVLSKDGFKLFPQPVVGDGMDPLNWSFTQKHSILTIVMAL